MLNKKRQGRVDTSKRERYMKKKNVLLVVVDCLRADFVYENKAFIPNMDKLREEGFSFLNTIASTTTTTPSFSSLITGMYPFENGVRSHSGYSLGKEMVTFPQTMQENGYHTYAELTGPLGSEIGLAKGFDEYNHRTRKMTIHTGWGDRFIARLKNHYKEPWLVMLHIWPPHEPREVLPECDNRKCGSTTYARSLSSVDKYVGKLIGNLDDNTAVVLTGDHGEEIAKSSLDKRQRKIRRKIFKFMLKHNLTKKPFSKGMRGIQVGHGYGVYDILVKIPLIFRDKDILPSGNSMVQVRQIDIFPTIAEFLELDYNRDISGKSVMPIVKGDDKTNRDALIEAVGTVIPDKKGWVAGLRVDNKYKYIYSPFRDDFEEELYDLEADPGERKNIASDNKGWISGYKKKIEDMKTTDLKGDKISDSDEKKVMERLKELGYLD